MKIRTLVAVAAGVLSLLVSPLAALADGYRYYTPRTYSRSYVKVIREQPIVVDQPDVFVVQNNLPAPITAQGDTLYRSGVAADGYQASAIPLFDPNAYARQALSLVKAANDTAALQAQRVDAFADRITAAQAASVEALARGEAAERVLTAAGLPQIGRGPDAAATGVVITRDAVGQLQVVQLAPSEAARYSVQANSNVSAANGRESASAGGVAEASQLPTVSRFCGACHGEQLAAPRGSLYLGSSPRSVRVIRDEFQAIIDRASTDMPPADSPQPTPQERAQIVAELTSAAQ